MPNLYNGIQAEAPMSLSDSMNKWNQVRNQKIAGDSALNRQDREAAVRRYYQQLQGARADPAQLNAIDTEAGAQAVQSNRNELQLGREQAQAAQEVARSFLDSLEREAKRNGVGEGAPEYQQLANSVFERGGFKSTMQNVIGKPVPAGDIDLQATHQVAGPSASEQAQAEIAQKVAMENALLPNKLAVANVQAGGKYNEMHLQDQLARQRDEEKFTREKEIKQTPAYSDISHETEKAKEKSDAYSKQIGQYHQSISDLERLMTLQDKVETGPIVGSDIMAAGRIAAGDTDLEQLKKGYAKAQIDSIGAMKANEVTFGALSDSERQWIQDASMSVKTTGSVNKELMKQGIALFKNSEDRLIARHQGGSQTVRTPPPARPGYKILRNKRTGEFKEVPE